MKEGTYLVTVEDQTNDGQTLFAHLPVFADSPIASVAAAASAVDSPGEDLDMSVPVTDGDSQDTLFAAVQLGTGSQSVPVNDKQIDLTNVAAPTSAGDLEANLSVYNGDVGEASDAAGQGSVPVNVWGVTIDQGEEKVSATIIISNGI